MKYSVAAATFMAVAVSAKPAFTNSYWNIEKDVPFKITFTGCENGCTIIMKNGKSTDLKYYKTLTATATDGSFTFTLTDDPSDTYGLQIIDNKTDEYNYSSQWTYVGTGTAAHTTTDAASTEAASTKADKTSVAETTASAKHTTLSKSKVIPTTEAVIPTPAAHHNATTPIASKTKASSTAGKTTAAETTTGSSSDSTASTVPKSGADRVSSSIALIAGAVAAMAYLN